MPKKPLPTEGAVTPAESLRFAAIAEEVMASPLCRMGSHASPEDAPRIGTLREKRLHAAVKRYERLTVEAVAEGNEEKAVEALMTHPLINSYSLARKLIADYNEAYGEKILKGRA